MLAVTIHQCEICGSTYRSSEDALICEGYGKPIELALGTVFQVPGPNYQNIVFALAANVVWGHHNKPLVWAIDDKPAVWEGTYLAVRILKHPITSDPATILPPDQGLTNFTRMLAALATMEFKPLIWTRPDPMVN